MVMEEGVGSLLCARHVHRYTGAWLGGDVREHGWEPIREHVCMYESACVSRSVM